MPASEDSHVEGSHRPGTKRVRPDHHDGGMAGAGSESEPEPTSSSRLDGGEDGGEDGDGDRDGGMAGPGSDSEPEPASSSRPDGGEDGDGDGDRDSDRDRDEGGTAPRPPRDGLLPLPPPSQSRNATCAKPALLLQPGGGLLPLPNLPPRRIRPSLPLPVTSPAQRFGPPLGQPVWQPDGPVWMPGDQSWSTPPSILPTKPIEMQGQGLLRPMAGPYGGSQLEDLQLIPFQPHPDFLDQSNHWNGGPPFPLAGPGPSRFGELLAPYSQSHPGGFEPLPLLPHLNVHANLHMNPLQRSPVPVAIGRPDGLLLHRGDARERSFNQPRERSDERAPDGLLPPPGLDGFFGQWPALDRIGPGGSTLGLDGFRPNRMVSAVTNCFSPNPNRFASQMELGLDLRFGPGTMVDRFRPDVGVYGSSVDAFGLGLALNRFGPDGGRFTPSDGLLPPPRGNSEDHGKRRRVF